MEKVSQRKILLNSQWGFNKVNWFSTEQSMKTASKYNTLIILLILMVASSIISDVFLTKQNIFNLLRQSIPLLLSSIGMLIVILIGGIDLSVGSIVGVGNMVFTVLLANYFHDAISLIPAVLITLMTGFLIGSITGALVAFRNLAPFIASLAMMTMARGCAYLITNGQPVRLNLKDQSTIIISAIGNESVPLLGIPWPVVIGIFILILFHLIIKYTSFGRLIVATGSNEQAVHLSGISVKKYKFIAYSLSGLLCSLAGIITTTRSGTGTPITGNSLELDAIASCVIGGAVLTGGKGSIINTFFGVLTIMLIGNIMNLLSVPPYPQQIAKGVIIIIAVLTQNNQSR